MLCEKDRIFGEATMFDASAKCNGVSQMIHQGPKLQRELFDVLLHFQRFPVAIVYDKKIYIYC